MGLFDKVKKLAAAPEYTVDATAAPLTPVQERGLAMGAPYAANMFLPMNTLAFSDPTTSAKMLGSAWGVQGPGDLDGAFRHLLDSGHRTYHAVVREHAEKYADVSLREARKMAASAEAELAEAARSRGLDPAQAKRFQMSYAMSASMGPSVKLLQPQPASIAAWDCARVVHVARMATSAGYATPDQVWDVLAEATELSRQHYSNWTQFGAGFLAGRLFWSGADNRFDLDGFDRDVEGLLSRTGSPWGAVPY